MGLDGIKQATFQHFEKVILIAVIAFVAMSVMGHMSAEDSGGPLGGGPGRGADLPAQHVPCGFSTTAGSYLDMPGIARSPYDVWWPPSVRYVGKYEMQLTTDSATQTIKVSAEDKIKTKSAKKINIPEEAKKGLDDYRRTVDSIVSVTIDESGQKITLAGTKVGRFVGYEVQLESGDKLRFFVIVHPPDIQKIFVLLPPEDVNVAEKEFGVVELSFKPPEARETEVEGSTTRIYSVPEYYIVLRQGPGDETPVPFGRIEAGGRIIRESKAPIKKKDLKRGRPPCLPGLPGLPGGAPGGGAPDAAPGDDDAAGVGGLLTFIDRSVDSEASYSYTVYGVGMNPLTEKAEASAKVKLGVTTKARFTFLSTGGKPGSANIIVIIGPRNEHEGYQTYDVPIGGRVGELPHLRKPGDPLDAEVPDQRYVTGYVLVDIVKNAFRLVEQTRTVIKRHPVTGAQTRTEEKTYWATYARYVILRDAKNRLLRIWVQTRPRDLPDTVKK